MDTDGQLRCLKLPAYYVPACKMRLLATTSYLETYQPEQICGDHTYLGFTGIPGDPTRGRIEGRVNPSNRIPTMTGYDYGSCESAVAALTSSISEVHDSNMNLTPSQKELLKWHSFLVIVA